MTDDGSEVVALTISSKVSGTYQSAHIAAADFPGKVFVVDSRSISLGAGVLAEYALSRVNAGAGLQSLQQSWSSCVSAAAFSACSIHWSI